MVDLYIYIYIYLNVQTHFIFLELMCTLICYNFSNKMSWSLNDDKIRFFFSSSTYDDKIRFFFFINVSFSLGFIIIFDYNIYCH